MPVKVQWGGTTPYCIRPSRATAPASAVTAVGDADDDPARGPAAATTSPPAPIGDGQGDRGATAVPAGPGRDGVGTRQPVDRPRGGDQADLQRRLRRPVDRDGQRLDGQHAPEVPGRCQPGLEREAGPPSGRRRAVGRPERSTRGRAARERHAAGWIGVRPTLGSGVTK